MMRRKFSVEDRIWFTSDTHFGHTGIIPLVRPQFQTGAGPDVERMDEILIHEWNDCIDDRDHVFHLGDFSFHNPLKTLEILGRLSGIKYLIRGNHDRNNLNAACLSMFDGGVEHYHEITVGSQLVCMCHFPLRSWNGMHHLSWNLHGHSHGSMSPIGKQLDVGVDVHDLHPIFHTYVAEHMQDQRFIKTDHHSEAT